ncbi:MAG: hypothetical protein RLZ98_1691 [Pseudomonadota bacterium]|jgi:hypothetical protein
MSMKWIVGAVAIAGATVSLYGYDPTAGTKYSGATPAARTAEARQSLIRHCISSAKRPGARHYCTCIDRQLEGVLGDETEYRFATEMIRAVNSLGTFVPDGRANPKLQRVGNEFDGRIKRPRMAEIYRTFKRDAGNCAD